MLIILKKSDKPYISTIELLVNWIGFITMKKVKENGLKNETLS